MILLTQSPRGMFLQRGLPKSLYRPGSSTTVLIFQEWTRTVRRRSRAEQVSFGGAEPLLTGIWTSPGRNRAYQPGSHIARCSVVAGSGTVEEMSRGIVMAAGGVLVAGRRRFLWQTSLLYWGWLSSDPFGDLGM